MPVRSRRHIPVQKKCPKGRGAKRPQGTRDGWAIDLVGRAGEILPPDLKWDKALRGSSVYPRGVSGTILAKNTAPEVRVPKCLKGPGTSGL